jgi:hypothetical protein
MTSCSCIDRIDPVLRQEGEDLLARAGLLTAVRHVRQIEADIASGHVKLRRGERTAAFGLTVERATLVPADTDFARARRHARQAREEVRQALAGDQWADIRERFDSGSDEFATSLDEFRLQLFEALDHADIAVPDAAEIAQAFDQAAETARGAGPDGLGALFDEQLSQFDDVLTGERDWGRESHSPLEWWQWLIIIGVLVIAVAALIACFWWSGCSWISAIWAAFCWGTVAAGGYWAGICLGFGF